MPAFCAFVVAYKGDAMLKAPEDHMPSICVGILEVIKTSQEKPAYLYNGA